MMFTELPLCERISAAAEAGFEGVEIQFPYDENLADVKSASLKSGMEIELINLPAGDRSAGEAGLAALPERRDEFLQGMRLCAEWAKELGVKNVNVLAGKPGDADPAKALETLVENLKVTAAHFEKISVQVLLEAINPLDVPGFFVDDLQTGLDVIKQVGHQNLQLQFDFYHMVRMGHSLVDAIEKAGPLIGHVQFADVPGRHEPGTGEIDFGPAISALKATGYSGEIAAEYNPIGKTTDGLGWMEAFKQQL